jgi:hypothetical protein
MPWVNWLWAWQNPHPDKTIVAVRFEPVSGVVIVSALAAGDASSQPLRWRTRRKACLTLSPDEEFQPALDEYGQLQQIQLDLGQVISATPRSLYPEQDWERSYNNQLPVISDNEILIEYSSHPRRPFSSPHRPDCTRPASGIAGRKRHARSPAGHPASRPEDRAAGARTGQRQAGSGQATCSRAVG